jgi:hypothetical protein
MYQKKFEYTEGVITRSKSKDRQYNGKKGIGKACMTNNDIQNTTQKTEECFDLLRVITPSVYSNFF